MSEETHEIPEHAKAGIAFAGVELNDAWGLIASVFAGVIGAVVYHWSLFIVCPFLGYIGTKAFLEWKRAQLHGYVATWLFKRGWRKITAAFQNRNTVFVGDSAVANPGLSDELDELTKQEFTKKDN